MAVSGISYGNLYIVSVGNRMGTRGKRPLTSMRLRPFWVGDFLAVFDKSYNAFCLSERCSEELA